MAEKGQSTESDSAAVAHWDAAWRKFEPWVVEVESMHTTKDPIRRRFYELLSLDVFSKFCDTPDA